MDVYNKKSEREHGDGLPIHENMIQSYNDGHHIIKTI